MSVRPHVTVDHPLFGIGQSHGRRAKNSAHRCRSLHSLEGVAGRSSTPPIDAVEHHVLPASRLSRLDQAR